MFRRGVGRAGRPSLLGTAARTAVVVGTAQAVSGGMHQRQAARAQEQHEAAAFRDIQAQNAMQAAPAPVAAAPALDTDRLIEQLKQLGQLHEAGVLTADEFAAQKARLLG